MKFRRMIALLMAISCLCAGTSTFTVNAATVGIYKAAACVAYDVLPPHEDVREIIKELQAELDNERQIRSEMESDYEHQIKELEAELDEANKKNSNLQVTIKSLNAELTEANKVNEDYAEKFKSLLRLDANGDGVIDAIDASVILTIYAYNSTHTKPLTTFDDLIEAGIIK